MLSQYTHDCAVPRDVCAQPGGTAIDVRCRMLTVSGKVINNLLRFMGTFVEVSLFKEWRGGTMTDGKRGGDSGLNK